MHNNSCYPCRKYTVHFGFTVIAPWLYRGSSYLIHRLFDCSIIKYIFRSLLVAVRNKANCMKSQCRCFLAATRFFWSDTRCGDAPSFPGTSRGECCLFSSGEASFPKQMPRYPGTITNGVKSAVNIVRKPITVMAVSYSVFMNTTARMAPPTFPPAPTIPAGKKRQSKLSSKTCNQEPFDHVSIRTNATSIWTVYKRHNPVCGAT